MEINQSNVQKMVTVSDCGPESLANYLGSENATQPVQFYPRIKDLMKYPDSLDWKDDLCDNPFHHLWVASEVTKKWPGMQYGESTAKSGVMLLCTSGGTWHWVPFWESNWFDGHKFVDGRPRTAGHTELLSYSFEYPVSWNTFPWQLYHAIAKIILWAVGSI